MSFYKTRILLILKHLVFVFFIFFFSNCVHHQNSQHQVADSPVSSVFNNIFDKAQQIDAAGDSEGAVKFMDSAITGKNLAVLEKFRLLSFKTAIYYYQKNAPEAMIFADSMMRLIEENDREKYKKEYAAANYLKGDVLMLSQNYNEAYSHFYKARLIGRDAVDHCTLGEYSYRIGMLLYQQSSFTEAADNFKQAFIETGNCTFDFANYYRMQELLNNTALSYQEAGINDSALLYAEKGLQYITRNDGTFAGKETFNEIAKAVVYGTMGKVYRQTGNYDQATTFFKKSITINSKKDYDNQDARGMELELAEVYRLSNNADSMQILLQKIRQRLDTAADAKAEIEWNRLMWKYYDNKNTVSKAYEYLDRYTHLRDSAEKVKSRNDLVLQIKTEEDRDEINTLHKENELKDLYLLIFIITSVLAVVIVLFFIYNYRNNRKNIKLLKNLNNHIEDQKLTLEKTLTELETRSREKDRILRAVAHDLRTPAASIAMLAELILSEPDPDSRNEMLRLVKNSSDNSLSLISEILEAAGIENSKELPKEEASVNGLLKNTVGLLRFQAAEKQQQISLHLLKEDKSITINTAKIGRVINNLITNAIKFSKAGDEIQVKAIQQKGTIQIIVKDNGIGIPDNIKHKVFDMFTEAKRVGTSGERPYGLGLSICQQIVEAHNGKIWFESEPGKGTAFYIELKEK